MIDVTAYVDAVKLRLTLSRIVMDTEIIQARTLEDQGFFRARLKLANDDFVEVAEQFSIRQGQVQTVAYRYQWMDAQKQRLYRRWDNATHHPELPNFPHHVHVGDKRQVEPGRSMNIIELIDLLEQEMGEDWGGF